LESIECSLKKAQEERDQNPKNLQEVDEICDSKISEIQVGRDDLKLKIEKSFLDAYEKVFSAKGGVAIVSAEAGICRGCFMKIRGQLYNQILKGNSLEECPSCKRLLYSGDQP
jgi:uncharacterized protein